MIEIAAYIDERCWSEKRQTYTRCADDESELDASVLLLARCGFREGREHRLRSTIDAIETELGAGEGLLYRYSGQRDAEGAFVACSFWLVEALVAVGEGDRAAQVMDASSLPTAAISACSRRRSIRRAVSSSATCHRGSATWP